MMRYDQMTGFTLIEVLVALVIVSVAVLSLGSFSISMVSSGQVSRERLTAVHLAEQVLEHWQHDANDFAPTIASDCSLSSSATIPAYPLNVSCTASSGVGIAYSIAASQLQATGPLPNNLGTMQSFIQINYANPPQTKLVTVSWSHKGQTRMVYLTHLSELQ